MDFKVKVKFVEHDLSSKSNPTKINPKEIEEKVMMALKKETIDSIRGTIISSQALSDYEVDFHIRLYGLLGNETKIEFENTLYWIKERIVDEWYHLAKFEVTDLL